MYYTCILHLQNQSMSFYTGHTVLILRVARTMHIFRATYYIHSLTWEIVGAHLLPLHALKNDVGDGGSLVSVASLRRRKRSRTILCCAQNCTKMYPDVSLCLKTR